MSLATALITWLHERPAAGEGLAPVMLDLDKKKGPPFILPMAGDGAVKIDLAPVELGDGDRRAIGITVSPGRPVGEYFGGAVSGLVEHDVDVFLVGRTEDDEPGTMPGVLQGVASMEPALDRLHRFMGVLPVFDAGGKMIGEVRVLSSTLDATDITSDDDLRTVTASFEYTILVRR